MLVGRLLEEQAAVLKNKTFIILDDVNYSFSDFNRMVNKTANFLKGLGIKKGTHVAMILPNHIDFLLLWFALAKMGAVMVPINTSLKKDGLGYILKQSDSEYLFLHKDLDPSIKDEGFFRIEVSDGELIELTKEFSDEYRIPESLQISDPMSIVYTSGTTSLPKGVVNSQNAYVEAGKDMAEFLGLKHDDLMYIFLPLFHVNPQFYGVMSSLYNGNSILVGRKFSVSEFWDFADKHSFSVFTYVGTVLSILCKKSTSAQFFKTMVRCVGGGAPRQVWEEVTNRLGIKVMELYGMTEVGGFTTGNNEKDWKFNSAGKPRESMDVRIFKPGDEECKAGEKGEIVVRPIKPFVIFDGYYKQPEKTVESLANLWFHTGDLGYFDDEGFLHYCGRLKEIIRHKGENITPFEIESTIGKYSDIQESAAVGIADELAEEEIKVALILNEGANFSLEVFVDYLEENLPRFMVPRYIEILEKLPKTATEKIERHKLAYLSENVIDIKKLMEKKI
ncbi:AMP-binding protein [Paenibacillus sp. BSR1-1]|uniref:AMP-binding protein n=1 Tax=Paenibacillus sp. BSR1-1 TaxID=3020845 RepID=UPI0025B08BEB|nr:AMP-binding protein [Paenibacillus sp. BSR1-1]MDN3020097.1 AMP-binding protein [Paenibacillus sp. BSR1-1]